MAINGSTAKSSVTRRSKSFLEFFAGIGLVHEGLRAAGWACVYANDIEEKKRQMYEGHFGSSPYYHVGDVWNTGSVLDRIPGDSAFLATASFPCVDLSLAGHWKGFRGDHSSTYFGFLEVLRQLRDRLPQVVMLENVHGFLTSHDGDDFERAVQELAGLGYWIDAIALDARWFVPQSRPRIFVFGFHESLQSPLLIRRTNGAALFDAWQSAADQSAALRPAALQKLSARIKLPTGWATTAFSAPAARRVTLDGVLDTDDAQAWWTAEDTLKHYVMMEEPSRERVDKLVAQRATTVGTAFRRTRRGKTRTEVRFDIAGCLRTPKGGSAKQIVVAIQRGKLRMRWMSAVEYARLQGAPEFRITVPETQAMFGFGDAVCVPAIRWISETILTPLYESAGTIRNKQSA